MRSKPPRRLRRRADGQHHQIVGANAAQGAASRRPRRGRRSRRSAGCCGPGRRRWPRRSGRSRRRAAGGWRAGAGACAASGFAWRPGPQAATGGCGRGEVHGLSLLSPDSRDFRCRVRSTSFSSPGKGRASRAAGHRRPLSVENGWSPLTNTNRSRPGCRPARKRGASRVSLPGVRVGAAPGRLGQVQGHVAAGVDRGDDAEALARRRRTTAAADRPGERRHPRAGACAGCPASRTPPAGWGP